MTSMIQAQPSDLDDVLELLGTRQDWLAQRGRAQWQRDFRSDMNAYIDAGQTWIMMDEQTPIATITLTNHADPRLWTPEEIQQPALYVAKMATLPSRSGEGLGTCMLSWALQYARGLGISRLRWDAWTTNSGLQQYYRSIGAKHLRTVEGPGILSGALFELMESTDVDLGRLTQRGKGGYDSTAVATTTESNLPSPSSTSMHSSAGKITNT